MNQPNYPQQPPPFGQPSAGAPTYPAPQGGQEPPPHGQQPGSPQGYPPGPPPAQAPAGRPGKKKRLVLGIVVALLLGLVAVAVYMNRNDASLADVGDCIKVNSASTSNADVKTIDCNDQTAMFKVAKKLGNDTDSCPGDVYEKYMQTGGKTGDFALCLMLNAKEGDCLKGLDGGADKIAKSDCAGADVKVSKVVAGSTDEKACGEDALPLAYPEPATLYCLTKP